MGKDGCRAWVLSGPERLNLQVLPTDHSVRHLRVCVAGLCGTDMHLVRGRLPAPYPIVLGHEIVGVLEDGEGETGIQTGERCLMAPTKACGHCEMCAARLPARCANRKTYGINISSEAAPYLVGGFSEYIALLPGFELFKLPDNLPNKVAVLAEPLACVLSAFSRAQAVWPFAGSSVAVIGAGPVGLLASIAAELLGARVVSLEAKLTRRRVAAEIGVSTIDPSEFPPRLEKMDHVIECAGSCEAVQRALTLVRRGGVVVVFGSFAHNGTAMVDPSEICNRELSILGSSTTYLQEYGNALRLLSWNVARFEPIVTHEAQLFDERSFAEALNLMEEGACGKICLVP